ncbi:hypothetical protein DdX_20552 [Ditylenchus destructor]|uniref:Uncharacterized protein n=1 Tax=Ditylenchus destructor TaxID=166010 RepID=A0AAD4MIJ5_9BILA|nr:hypothetical protein DdX_20552 [Ditylenchus destructor]
MIMKDTELMLSITSIGLWMIPSVVLLHLFLAEFIQKLSAPLSPPTNFWGPADREDRKLSERKARAVNKTFI